MFHGHNSEGAPWEAHSTNPREPDTLSFEYVRYCTEIFDKSSVSKLSAASKAIADWEDTLQLELLIQLQVSQQSTSTNQPKMPVDLQDKVDSTTSPMEMKDSIIEPVNDKVAKDGKAPLKEDTISHRPGSKDQLIDVSEQTVEQLCLAAYLLSPTSSGLYDELLALVHMGILEISYTGIPLVAEDWASKVDIVVLDDMENGWGVDVDPAGRYCINTEMRDALHEEWVKNSDNGGWALASDPEDVIFDPDVLEEWRQFFQGQLQEKANISEGIGRFGL